ncbi:MAG: universal stress protein [Kiritimatiellia bacterium]
MIKSILVCTDGSPHGDTACDYAVDFAARLQARIMGLHVLDSRMLEGPLMADISGWVGAQPFGMQLQQFRELMEKKGEAVMDAFTAKCEKAGIKTESWIKMGHPARIILEEEARAELVVMGQKGEHAEWIGDMMGSSVERIVRRSVLPCLITPKDFTPVKKILAAFDGSAHANKALHEAIEMAATLSLPLTVLTVRDGMSEEKADAVAADARRLAKDHGCEIESMVEKGEAEDVILNIARAKECSLIVVGAYGHSRIREMILGSTTAHLVAYSEVPVLLVR